MVWKGEESNRLWLEMVEIIKNGSFIFKSVTKKRIIINNIKKIMREQKMNPNSSPATAKIKSVLASGILSLRIPCPGPLPNKPPD